MKKCLFTLFALFLMVPTVFAGAQRVLTLETETEGNRVNFNGTIESGSHAVMCKLYDADNHEVDMLSVAVENGAFAGSFTVKTAGNYKVACANYEGGTIRSDTTEVTNANPAPSTYTVRFVVNGGSPIDDVVVDAGQKVNEPEAPHKDDMVFGGWYEDATFTTSFDFNNTPITADTTLYAKWNEIVPVVVHTIFNGEGGSYTVDFYTVGVNAEQGPIAVPTTRSAMYYVPEGNQMVLWAEANEGYHFRGWYTVREVDPNGDGNMEWEEVELLSSDTNYRFVPTGTPYIAPSFERDEAIVHRVIFETNCEDHIDDVEVEHDGVVPEPRHPEREGFTFEGWYEDETLTTEYDFETRVQGDVTLYAKWTDNRVNYTVSDDNGNQIQFKDEDEHEFAFFLLDLGKLDEEELSELTGGELTKEVYNEAEAALKESLESKGKGTLISVYEIIVVDENDHGKEMGPFTIKIKKTDDMKDFNTFKLLYVDTDDEDFKIEETITLVEQDGYLVGTLEHLSSYVLVGSVTTPATNNPQTLDNIYVWIITLLISIVGLLGGYMTTKKSKVK